MTGTVYYQQDNFIELDDLRNEATERYITSATVTGSWFNDTTNAPVTGVQALAMPLVGATGRYRVAVPWSSVGTSLPLGTLVREEVVVTLPTGFQTRFVQKRRVEYNNG